MNTTKTEQLKQFTYISDWAKELLEKVPEDFEIDETRKFKCVTLRELGFTDTVTTKDFLNNEFLSKHGLSLCKPEDLFEVAKQVKDYCYVGMNQILDRDANPSVFYLSSGGVGLRLGGDRARSGSRWDPGSQFVFLASTVYSEPENLNLENAIKICKEAGLTVTKTY